MYRPMRLFAWRALLAISIVYALSGCHGKTVEDYISAGDTARQANKLEEAEGDYKQALALAPNDARPHVALGDLYIFEHKPAPAQLEFMKVLDLDPKNAPAHVALGNLYGDQGQYGLAEGQYRAAIAIDPTRSNYHSDLGTTLGKEAKSADAETELRTAIGLDPKNAQAHYQLGNLLASLPNRQAEANAEYDQAKSLDPKLTPPVVAAPSAPPAATGAPAAAAKIKRVNKVFLLTHDSAVYENPDAGSTAVGKVRRKKYVHVIGITGTWLQVKLKNGTVGFVPTSAAE